jgi:hypothetical protein
MYLGTVAHTRTQDLWVQLNVPQLLGKQESNWARPIGFNSVGNDNPPVANVLNDGEGIDEHRSPLGWGGWNDQTATYSGRPVGSGKEIGPGPPVGTLVLVWFVAGDVTRPAYALTSQKVG